jgi:membrane protein YqaA with SNARE-associated domain
MLYLAVFLSALTLDFIPIIAPPAWTILVFLVLKFHLNPWIAVPASASGSTLGRYLMSLCVPKFSKLFLKRNKHEELQFVGKKLSKKLWHSWLFVFVFAVTPLSDTVLFTAGSIAKVKPIRIVPPFFCAKLVSDAVMLVIGCYTVASFANRPNGAFPWKGILTIVFGVMLIAGLVFLDGRALLKKRKFTFNFNILK